MAGNLQLRYSRYSELQQQFRVHNVDQGKRQSWAGKRDRVGKVRKDFLILSMLV